MMRCIDNAVAAGYISPDEGHQLQREINRLLRQGIAPPEMRARMSAALEAEAREVRRRALLMEEKRAGLERAVMEHRNARGENDPAAALIYLLEHNGQARFADVEHRRLAIVAGVFSDIEAFLWEFRKGAITGDKRRQKGRWFANDEVIAKLDNVVRELHGENTGSKPAKEMAQAMAAAIEDLRQRANSAGMHIAKLDNYVPQQHDSDVLKQKGQKSWVDYHMTKGVLARHRMLTLDGKPMDDDTLRAALEHTWQRVTTDGWIDREPSEIPYGKGPLYNQRNDARFLHYKDADAWLAYQRDFAGGDPYSALLGYVAKMARDIAFMEVMGPNPQAMKTWLQQLVMKQAAVAQPAAIVIAEQTARLRELVAQATGSDRYVGLASDVGRVVQDLADLHRRVSAHGPDVDVQVQNAMWNKVDELERLYARAGDLEAGSPVARRAAINERLTLIGRELDQIGGKAAPQLGGGLSRRNRKRQQQLQDEATRLERERDVLAPQGATLDQVAPELTRGIREMIDAMRGDVTARGRADDMSGVESVIEGLIERMHRQRTFQGEVDTWRRLRGEDEAVEAVMAQARVYEYIGKSSAGAKFTRRGSVDIAGSIEQTVQAFTKDAPSRAAELAVLDEAAKKAWTPLAWRLRTTSNPQDAHAMFVHLLRDLADDDLATDTPALRRGVREVLRKAGMPPDDKAPLLRYQPEAEMANVELDSLLTSLRDWHKTGDRKVRDRFAAEFEQLMKTDLAQVGIDAAEIERTLRLVLSSQEAFERPAGFRAVKDPQSSARAAISHMDSMWNVMRGNGDAPEHAGVANFFQSGRNIMSGALLGQALLSSLSDVVFQMISRRFAGMNGSLPAVLGGTVRQFARGNRREAVRAGLILDSALHVMQQQARFLEGVDTRTMTGYMADRVITYSGLSAWTQAGKHAFGMAMQAEFADRVKLSFHELPELLRRTLQRHGMESAEWDVIRKAQLYNPTSGVELLRPNEIAKLGVVDGGLVGRDVAEAYLSMIHRETKYAVPESTLQWEAMIKQNKAGTVSGELARNFGQFKSFAAAVLMLHGGRIAGEWQGGRQGHAAAMTASLLITGVMAGALVIELKDIVNGKDPRGLKQWQNGQVPGYEYWMGAMLQAGGLGIVGDFMFSGVNRIGGGLSSFLIGPLGGQLDRIRDRTFGNVDELGKGEDTKWRRELTATARDLLPGGTLWYLRLAKERLVLNQLEYALDPKAAGRSWGGLITTVKKKQHTEYWWRPGETAPRRSPLGQQQPL